MEILKRMFFGVMWSGSLIACSVSGAALAHVWTRDPNSGLEMFRLAAQSPFLLPVLIIFGLYRFAFS